MWVNPDYPNEIVGQRGVDTRNVIDHYKFWDNDAIRADLQARATPLHVVAENFAHDFNIATLVRNANAFNAGKVTIVGRRGWDKRGAVGTQHYSHIEYAQDADAFYAGLRASGVPIVAVDNIEGATPLHEFEWERGTPLAVVFGQEAIGVSNTVLAHASACVYLPQLGSVRSLNVGACSGIVMYDYALRTGQFDSFHGDG